MRRPGDDLLPPEQPDMRRVSLPPRPSDPEINNSQSNNEDDLPYTYRTKRGNQSFWSRWIPWKTDEDTINERRPLKEETHETVASLLVCTPDNLLWCVGWMLLAAGGSLAAQTEYLNKQNMKDINETHIIGWQRTIAYAACTCGACAVCLAYCRTACCKSKSP